RSEAARGLAKFPKGREVLRKAALDSAERPSVRLAALRVLNANDGEVFPSYALRIAEDEKSSPELRAYGLSGLTTHVAAARSRKVAPDAYNPAQVTSRVRAL